MKPFLYAGKLNLPGFLILAITIISFFIFLDTPYTGDDLAYKGVFAGVSPRYDSWLQYPRWVVSHWLTTNGRLANYLMPLLGSLPKFIVALLCAGVLGLMYRMAVTLSGVGKGIIAGICFALPWWDAMHVFDCQLNYVWASAFSLVAVWIIFTIESDSWWFTALSALICFGAAMMHEAASLPIMTGFAVYILYARWHPGRLQWIMLAVFAAGTACVLLSPGIIMRAGQDTPADDALLPLLLKSDVIAASLWLIIIVMAFFRSGREELSQMFSSRLCVFAVAALIGTCISLASGIVGRSGWFAELSALIVIFGWIGRHIKPLSLWANLLVGTAVVAQLAGVAVWQHRLGGQFAEFEDEYVSSSAGTVFLDYTRDNELPWWALGRLRGVLDPDDVWLLSSHAAFFRTDGAWPVVLPVEAEKHLPLQTDETVLHNGDILVKELPACAKSILSPREGLELTICQMDGAEWVAQPLPGGGWHLSPRMLDPGDR